MKTTNDVDDRYFRSPFSIETTTPMVKTPVIVSTTVVVTLPLMETVSNDISYGALFNPEEG